MERMKISGNYDLKLYDEFGRLKDERNTPNLITTAGFDGIIQKGYATQTGSNSWNFIAVGSGTAAAAAANTTLGSEAARAQGTYAHTDGQANFSVANTFAAGTATGSITEAGLFNSGVAGQLFSRQVFAVINKGAADTLAVTWVGSLS
jgi:hypothetical protein